jgi:hypothetical protein
MPAKSIRNRIEEQGAKVKRQAKKSAVVRKHGEEALAHSQAARKKLEISKSASESVRRAQRAS